jgi:hypothetical protein
MMTAPYYKYPVADFYSEPQTYINRTLNLN